MTTEAATLHSASADYQAALAQSVFFDVSVNGRLILRDRDRADLLNRLSTNNIIALQPGQGIRTVLTNHIGRIIDVLTVAVLPEELLLLGSPAQGSALTKLFRKNIFFNDKLTVENRTATTCQLMLYGPQAPQTVRALTGLAVDDLPLFHVRTAELRGGQAFVVRELPLGGQGFALIAAAELAGELPTLLQQAGAVPLSAEAYTALRVEAGYPSFGHELSLEYIPLETGLHDAISFHKGCYVGQEIIARMESRNRLAKVLRGLRLSALAAAPAKLEVAGKEAGDLTSVAVSPRFGPIALAYVRSAYAQAGSVVAIAGTALSGEVVELPFN